MPEPSEPVAASRRFARLRAAAVCVIPLFGAMSPISAASAAETRERLETAAFAVARDASGQRAAAEISALLRNQIAYQAQLKLIDPGRRLAGDPKTREEENLARARAALADGRRAYDALKLDDAIARLGQSVSLYQQTGPLLGDLRELAVALSYLGGALVLRGSQEEAVSTFLELLTLDPGHTLERFPPTVQQVFDRASERLGTLPTGSVELYSTPPYAAAFVDGKYRGVTPLPLDDLTTGTHYLRLEKDGYVIHGGPFDVAPRQKITSQTRLGSIARGAEVRDLVTRSNPEVLAEGMGSSLRALGRMLLAERLIMVSVAQSGRTITLTGAAFDANQTRRLGTERAVLSSDSPSYRRELEDWIRRLMALAVQTETRETPGTPNDTRSGGLNLTVGAGVSGRGDSGASEAGPSTEAPPPSFQGDTPPSALQLDPEREGTPFTTYLGWSLVAAGGAAIVGGIVLGAFALVDHNDYKATPQASPDLSSIRDSGQTRALIADLCLVTGAAAAAGGALTLILTARSKRPSPVELLGNAPSADEGFSFQNARIGVAPIPGGGLLSFGASLP